MALELLLEGNAMKNLLLALRLAVRQLRRSPGFVFSAVLILALGIAANVIVFGVLQGLILQPTKCTASGTR